MRTLALLVSTTFTLVSAVGWAQANAELAQVQTVYLMPMANGFDQYLANRLRSVSQIRIVTDASKADAVFTDRIGTSFESKLEEIEVAAREKLALATTSPLPQDAVQPDSKQGFKFAPKIVTSIGRGRGTYFLVDRRSRLVLWSTYQAAKDMQPKTLHLTAGKIAGELGKDFISPKNPKK